MKFTHKPLVVALAGMFTIGALYSTTAMADTNSDEVTALKAQMNALMKRIDELSKKQEDTSQEVKKSTAAFERAEIPKRADSYKPGTVNMHTGESNPNAVDSDNFLQRTRDDSLTFKMPSGGGITLYGNFNLSVDDVTNGISKISNGTDVGANNGYLPAISTNSSNIGLRGFQPVSDWKDTQFLWQLQTNFALSAVSATSLSNSAQSNTVTGGLTTGTTYIGLGSKSMGTVKIGKTVAPYASSTNVFNPFQGMLGSMNVVMGNTGGDNRVEFGTLMEHSIWYESPNFSGLSFAALYSPGQNRALDSSAIPAGGSNCNGGNIPGSGGLIGGAGSNLPGAAGSPDGCNDGGFSNAFSASVVYDDKTGWYLTAAYEIHHNVNRGSDFYGSYWAPTVAQANALYALDVGNESAAKVGVMYRFKSVGTTIGGVYEDMRRGTPSSISYMNERQRKGSWLLIQQDLPGANQVNVGWGHAGTTPGDPAGQHNFNVANLTSSTANMYTISATHQVDRNLSFYGNWAETRNKGNDHYDLGAGGHGITTDCHSSTNGVPANGGFDGAPQCWAGSTLEGLSLGMGYRF